MTEFELTRRRQGCPESSNTNAGGIAKYSVKTTNFWLGDCRRSVLDPCLPTRERRAMRELHVEVCAAWKGVVPLGDDSSAIWIPGRDGDRAAYWRWWCRLVVGTPPLCSRETCSATRLQMRTPGSSFAFSSSLIFFLTTSGALRPYQAWQARAYMTAASSSVKCMVSTEKSSGLRSPPCLPTDRHLGT